MHAQNAEMAWAAGLFEGEGTITLCGSVVHLRLNLTDFEVLERFWEIVGTGKIYGPYTSGYRDGYTRKPRWVWVCYGPLAQVTFRSLAPWLSPRRLARGEELGLRSM
jgi:hypothetical protein